MFPNDNQWITYIKVAASKNESPCWSDIVGDITYPAAYYYIDNDDISFRMRLNGDPLKNNKNELNEFVWGVEIKYQVNSTPKKYTVRVNTSGNNYKLQILDNSGLIIYQEDITLGTNVRVIKADSNFPCPNNDDDFFLDFKVPKNKFNDIDFENTVFKLCYFTSTQDNIINKEYLCGDDINQQFDGKLEIKKTVEGPTEIKECTEGYWKATITVKNISEEEVTVTNVVVTDYINNSFVFVDGYPIFSPTTGVTFDSTTNILTWIVGNLAKDEEKTLTIEFKGHFVSTGEQYLNTAEAKADNAETVYVTEGKIDVLPIYEGAIIKLEGKILDCKTNVPLEDVTVKLYQGCTLILTAIFDKKYSFNLVPGIYTIIFEKDGYYTKFIAPILYTTENLSYDVKLLKKEVITSFCNTNIDIFVDRILERIDGNILFNKVLCSGEEKEFECGCDIIDEFRYEQFGNRLKLYFKIEKNIVYKIDGVKNLNINITDIEVCYPISTQICGKEFKYKYVPKKYTFCKDCCKLYNFFDIEFKGFFVEPMDILIKGEVESDC